MSAREQNPERWSTSVIFFHWLMAILIVLVMTLGWVADSYPSSPDKVTLFVWHKSFGLMVLLLFFLRVISRWKSRTPHHSIAPWESLLGRGVQGLLYLCMLVMPLSGWIINSAADFPLKVFWLLPLPPLTGPNESVAELAETFHLTLFWVMISLLLLHIAGALRHHFIDKNEVLRAMLPGTKSGSNP